MNNPNPNHEDDDVITIPSTSDISQALTGRYARSKAPQHRHLIATAAAAMKSILLEENLPLTPPAFFAAAITAFADHSSSDSSDSHSIAAISAFLAILLSVDSMVVPKAKAREAALLVAGFLKSDRGMATGSVRCLIKAFGGGLVVRVDLEDWDAVEMGLRTLLLFSVNKRPKVRKCAQICVEKFFKTLKSRIVIKNASKVVFGMYKKYAQMAEKLNSSVDQTIKVSSKSEHLAMLHMLNVLTVIVPNLSNKVRMKILSVSYMLLGSRFSSLSRHFLKLFEALVEYSHIEVLTTESENFFPVITSFLSSKQNPVDTVISASALLKDCLKKLNAAQPRLWIRFLPPIFASLVGHLNCNANMSKHVEDVLKELITTHLNQ